LSEIRRLWRAALASGLLLPLLFALAYRKWPLYASNQNTYFLHGLARAGVGRLADDWLARTADPVPVFSALVEGTVRTFGPMAFLWLHMALLAVFAWAVMGIVERVCGLVGLRTRTLAFAVLLVLWHAGQLKTFPAFHPDGWLARGVAGQYVLGPILQPSVFGVFLVLSIRLFLDERLTAAMAAVAVAALFHPTYLPGAFVLGATYLAVHLAGGGSRRRALAAAAVAVVPLLPLVLHLLATFRPGPSAVHAAALDILVHRRIPHHAVPAVWFDRRVLYQVLVLLLALAVARGTRLLPVLAVSLVAGVALTAVQVATGSDALALLFPWRVSVYLVPVSACVVFAAALAAAAERLRCPLARRRGVVRGLLLAALAAWGVRGTQRTVALLREPRIGVGPLTAFAAGTDRPGDLWLVPPDLQTFRLAAGVPILVDHKSHPYRDAEVVEWSARLRLAERFYAATDTTAARRSLATITARYPVTRVVVPVEATAAVPADLREVYRDAAAAVYAVGDR